MFWNKPRPKNHPLGVKKGQKHFNRRHSDFKNSELKITSEIEIESTSKVCLLPVCTYCSI